MVRIIPCAILALIWLPLRAAAAAVNGPLPPPAGHRVDFAREIKPTFEASCIKCHARGRDHGGFSIETRDHLLKGGDTGAAVALGQSGTSYLVELVAGADSDLIMPQKGSRLTPAQVGLVRAWIDQGMSWDPSISFALPPPHNLTPRLPAIPAGSSGANPIDRFLAPYFASHGIVPAHRSGTGCLRGDFTSG
jgi:mono/diheme cytochrome c family protein